MISLFSLVLAALPPQDVTVGSATASPGKTAYGAIAIAAGPDSALNIPVAVIRGARPGKTVAFVAGSHGTEYASIVAMQRLIPRIDATKLAGTVIIVPLINVGSIEQMVPHTNPIDKKSLNGNYPGDPNGTQSPRALYQISKQVVDPSDVVVDLHGGDLDEDLRPYSYWFRGGNAAQDDAGKTLALAFGLDHIIVTNVNPASPTAGRSLSTSALVKGKVVLVAEAGRSGVSSDADVNALVDGSLNVLGSLGMLDRRVTPLAKPTWLNGAGARVAADTVGMWFQAVPRDARVKQGDLLGRLTDYLGRPIKEYRSPVDGVVTFIRGVPSTWKGATLANVAPVFTTVPAWSAP